MGNSALVAMVKKSMGVEAFTEAALQLIRQPGISKCTQDSVLGGMLKAAIFNFRISPELGQCWLVPRSINVGTKENKVWADVATFQIGYKGWQELAFRSGLVESFDSGVVWENDSFDYEQGTQPFLKHKACANPNQKGKRTHVWASATMKSGRVVFNVCDIEEIERHRRIAKSQDIWDANYDQMAKRVPMRYLCTLQLPKSDELLSAAESDGASIPIVEGELKMMPISEVEPIAAVELHEDYVLELETEASRINSVSTTETIAEVKEDIKRLYKKRSAEFTPEKLELYQKHFSRIWNALPKVNAQADPA